MKLSDLTPSQLRQLGEAAGTSEAYMRHLAKGRRTASAGMAAKIETAALKMGLAVGRETMCEACRTCKYRRECAKAARKS